MRMAYAGRLGSRHEVRPLKSHHPMRVQLRDALPMDATTGQRPPTAFVQRRIAPTGLVGGAKPT